MERQDNDINEIALSLIPGMGVNESFDVFLSYNSQDKPMVMQLANALQVRGLKVWLDEWELVPGRCWQEALEKIIQTTHTAAVLIGKDGLGPWENPEMRACLSEFVDRHLPVIPVLLPDAPVKPDLPLFLRAFTWVDLRSGFTEAGLDQLQWGITGFNRREDRIGSMQEADKAQRKQSQSGHDHRFGHDKRTAPMPFLDKSNIHKIVDLLTPLMERENERRALLILALGHDALPLRQLDLTGAVEPFLVNMIKALMDYGEVAPGKQALWALLEVVRERVGVDRQAKIDALYPVINALGRNDDQGSQSLRSAQDRLRLKAAQAKSGPASIVVNVDAKNSHDATIIGHVGGSVSISKTKSD